MKRCLVGLQLSTFFVCFKVAVLSVSCPIKDGLFVSSRIIYMKKNIFFVKRNIYVHENKYFLS